MINLLRNLLKKDQQVKSSVSFHEQEIADCAIINRQSLESVENWIDETAFQKSWFQYGVPDFIRNDINRPISLAPTYTDVMLLAIKKYFPQLSYLEIGVSVGKNFFQLLNAVNAASLTGFDIEEFNPILEKKLKFISKTEWKTPDNSIKKTNSSLKEYTFQNNQVKYLCADVWDTNGWSRLEGNKYNLIFSDALHSAEAILFEFEMLVKYQLLADRFIIVWDDLAGKMKTAFFNILKKYRKEFEIQDAYLIQINGWIGEHEAPHAVGLISNFPLQ